MLAAGAGMNLALYRTLHAREQKTDETDPDAVPVDAPEVWEPDGTWHEQQYWGGKYKVRLPRRGGEHRCRFGRPILLVNTLRLPELQMRARQLLRGGT